MRKLGLALGLLLWSGLAQAQNFSMPPPAGVSVGAANEVASCGGQTLTTGAAFLTVDATGKLCVAATVSASVTGFAPGGAFATLTATGSSASVALPTGAVVLFQNTGTTAVSCTLGIGSATATASENIIQSGSSSSFTVGSNTYGACIDQTGSASNVVVLSGGTGLFTGVGGGGGGSGGAVTLASGAVAAGAYVSGSILTGAIVDLVTNTATTTHTCSTGGNSVLGCLGQLDDDVKSAIPSGTSRIGYTSDDPCAQKTKKSVAFSTGSDGALLFAGTSSTNTYICSVSVITSAAANFGIGVGSGSSVCTSGTPLALIGSTTAANGLSLPANGGLTIGNGFGTVVNDVAAAAQGYNVCIRINGTANLAGSISYVQQ